MTLRTKMVVGVVLVATFVAVIVILSSRPRESVVVKLWNGEMRLVQTDSGKNLCYGGAAWQRVLFKLTGAQPRLRYSPTVIKAAYTNGLALRFSHDFPMPAGVANGRQIFWNGSGKMFYVSPNGVEAVALLHTVMFNLDKKDQGTMSEELWFEIPLPRERELHMRIYETNGINGVMSTNGFRMRNPAL